MPLGQQRASRAYIAKPLSTISFDFFSSAFANSVRLGLFRSATRNVGCLPWLLPTYGCWGSKVTGCAPPGTATHSVPSEIHPAVSDERSSPLGELCASAAAVETPTIRPAASSFNPGFAAWNMETLLFLFLARLCQKSGLSDIGIGSVTPTMYDVLFSAQATSTISPSSRFQR